ncbi:alkaline phosphatase family protein [Paraburkholderia diazotrophica]|uniref:alkaline phosphatase family protein n=1 Tax=Paraburkholderia diazotrophica TaxID=667676 RepID=UPI00317E0F65
MSDHQSSNAPDPTRRKLLAALAGTVALSACGGGGGEPSGSSGATSGIPPDRANLPRPALPDPATSGVDHIVLVTMENRSFDHMFGWIPNAEHQQNRQFPDAFGQTQSSFALTSNAAYGFQACSFSDPNHQYSAGRTQLANGAMNGFLLTPGTSLARGDLLPIGYFGAADLDFYRGAVTQYTVCDYYMSGVLSATFPNRLYLHSGETDRLDDSTDTCSLPTIWDRLDAKNISSSYYFHDVPFTALYGSRYVGRSKLFANFLTDAASGNLPSFCMVDPSFAGEAQGTSNDDHPHADVRNGQVLLGQIYDALRTGPKWSTTLMILVYDEWGGFMEHAVPPVRPVSTAEKGVGNDGRLGFRVPCMMLGPRTRANMVSRYPFDPSSIHQLLAWRFGIDPVGVRATDPATFNMAYALDFSDAARTDAPSIAVTQGAFGVECSAAGIIPGLGGVDRGQQLPSSAASSTAVNPPGGRFADLRAKATALGFPGGM